MVLNTDVVQKYILLEKAAITLFLRAAAVKYSFC